MTRKDLIENLEYILLDEQPKKSSSSAFQRLNECYESWANLDSNSREQVLFSIKQLSQEFDSFYNVFRGYFLELSPEPKEKEIKDILVDARDILQELTTQRDSNVKLQIGLEQTLDNSILQENTSRYLEEASHFIGYIFGARDYMETKDLEYWKCSSMMVFKLARDYLNEIYKEFEKLE